MQVCHGTTQPLENLYLNVISDLRNADEIEVFSDLIEIDDEENNSLGLPLRERPRKSEASLRSDLNGKV